MRAFFVLSNSNHFLLTHKETNKQLDIALVIV